MPIGLKLLGYDIAQEPFYNDKLTKDPLINDTIHDYILIEKLIKTNSSIIYKALDIHNKHDVVMKFIKRKSDSLDRISNEVFIMKRFHHERIITPMEDFLYNEFVCIVTPYANHGSLQSVISEIYPTGIPEDIARIIMMQMAEAIAVIHSSFVCHNDIKPDNFLVTYMDQTFINVLLTDFGISSDCNDIINMTKKYGTMNFIAPEYFDTTPHDLSADIWSLGISFFIVLTGQFPFSRYERFPNDCIRSIRRGKLNYSLLESMKISRDAINLIKEMCAVDPKKRPTIEKVLNHPFFSQSTRH